MSNATFPTLAGADISIRRVPLYNTAVKTSRGGYEQRVSYAATPRYRYELKLNFLRDAPGETQQVLDFVALHRGRWDSFLLLDPITNANVRVRFDMDEFEFDRFLSQVWEVKTLNFISLRT